MLQSIQAHNIFSYTVFLNMQTTTTLSARNNMHGFRNNRSCEAQLLETIDDLAMGLNNGKQADVLSLDFSNKAVLYQVAQTVTLCY